MIEKEELVNVLEDPIFAERVLQASDAGTYMWWPEVTPHITGGARPPGAVTENLSTLHCPSLLVALIATGQLSLLVALVTVTALFNMNVSKSSLDWQMSLLLLQTFKLQVEPLERLEEVK